jgi:hypothetical protein
VLKPGVVVHICTSALEGLRQEDLEFKASLGYIVRLCLKKKERGRERKREREKERRNGRFICPSDPFFNSLNIFKIILK